MPVQDDTPQAPPVADLPWAARTGAARDRLVAQHLPLVRRLSYRFSHSGEPLEDLVQVGSLGLLKAIEKYDPQRGSPFTAYAVPLIVGEIKNYFRDHGWAVKVPRKLQHQKLEVQRVVERLRHHLMTTPTIPQIAQATGFSEEEVLDTFEVERYGRPLSLEADANGQGGEEASPLRDLLGSDDPSLEAVAPRLDLTQALRCLEPRERTILYLRFFHDLPQTAIAQRLGISQMHVSRLLRLALAQLRTHLSR